MKTKLKYIVIASLLFGVSGFNSAKAITADELLADIIVPVYQFVIDTFTAVGQVLGDHETRIGDNEARTTALETEPKANIAVVAPTAFDDINAGFTEGSVWVDTTNKDAYILVDSAPGAAVWEQIKNHTHYYRIGDTGPAGGIVFYVTDGGLHGLEAAPVDQALVDGDPEWGCFGFIIAGADGTAIGTGAQNTADILADCAELGFAARLADAYTLNGFDDWFLPSKDELNELYLHQGVVGGFANNGYWSSSEVDAVVAWFQFFFNGNQFFADKSNIHGVRPVRAF